MDILYRIYQQNQINTAQTLADKASDKVSGVAEDMRRMERKLETMALTSQAMWELLRERSDITDEMLMQRMVDIDLRDGVKDGKMSVQPVMCAACGRGGTTRRSKCMYCGAELPLDHVFQRT